MSKMWRQSLRTAIGAFVFLGLSACGSSSDTNPLASNKGQVRTVTGALKNIAKGAAVGAKLENGRTVKGVIDPKTKKFVITLPKNQSAILSVKNAENITKKIKFVRNKIKGVPGALVAESGETYACPKDGFMQDADLGSVDWNDGDEILIGDDQDENSIFEFVDADGDNTSDFDDSDYEESWGDDDWVDDFNEEDWSFFEADDTCSFDSAEVCYPEDDEYFSESECDEGGADAESFCLEEGDEGYDDSESADSGTDDWWTEDDSSTDDSGTDSTDENTDGGTDMTDMGTDGETDSGTDGETDSGTDGETDSGTDGGTDMTDMGTDGETDSGTDGGTDMTDMSTDGGTDTTDMSTDGGTDTTDMSPDA